MTTGDKHRHFLTRTATIWSKYTIDPFVTWGTEKKNITEHDSQVTESMRDSQATNPRAESFSKQHPRKHRDKSLELEAISLTHRFCAIPPVLITSASSHSLLAAPHHTPRSSISISEFCQLSFPTRRPPPNTQALHLYFWILHFQFRTVDHNATDLSNYDRVMLQGSVAK